MSRDLPALPVFTSKTRCTSSLLLTLQLFSTAALFTLYAVSTVYRTTLLLSSLVGAVSTLCGILGLCRSTPAVVASFMVSVESCFSCALLGGLCILFISDVELEVELFFDNMPVLSGVDRKEKLVSDTRNIVGFAAAILTVNAVAHLVFSWRLRRLIGERRASAAFLQIFGIVMFPLSFFLILGGNYVVDTGILASAPYTGLAMFVGGVLLLIVALLAFIGGSFEYRRLLSICHLISAVIGAFSVVLAIIAFAGRTFVENNILNHWESIRILLPPTAQIAYDRDRFAAAMQSNLNTVAYVDLLSGVFVLAEAGMSLTLMRQVSSWKQKLGRAKHRIKDLQQTAVGLNQIGPSSIESQPASEISILHQWSKHFDLSTRRQRIAMRILLVFITLAVAFILAVMCASAILTAKCSNVDNLAASTTFPLINSSVEATTVSIHVENSFTRGKTAVSAATSTTGSVNVEIYGSGKASLAPLEMSKKFVTNDKVNVDIRPLDVTRFLWLEESCQRSLVDIVIPQDRLRALVLNSNASVVINGSVSFLGLNVTTTQSSILCSDVYIQGDELLLQSTSGDISVNNLTVDASDLLAVESSARVYSALGFIRLSGVTLSQCDLHVETEASSLVLSDVHSSVNSGRSRILAQSSSASISVDDIQANWITLTSSSGHIYGTELLIESNSAFIGRLEVTTVSGDIELTKVTASCTVHVESASGKIYVQMNTQTFAGMYYMRSDYGTITLRQSDYSSDIIVESATSLDRHEKHGSINCDPTIENCLALGNLFLRSNFGDVELVLGCDSYSCS